MSDRQQVNIDAYRNDEALEAYTSYALFPNEKRLFLAYFTKGSTVLDLACGAGRTTVRLHEFGYRVKGVDISDVLIGAARRRFPHIPFEQGDYCAIAEADESFDHVLISHNGIDYAYPEERRILALQECRRVLRAGGTMVLSTHNIRALRMSPYFLLNRQRILWMLMNFHRSFDDRGYLQDLGMWTYFIDPDAFRRQAEDIGFSVVAMVGFRGSSHRLFNLYCSPYIHFVLRKE